MYVKCIFAFVGVLIICCMLNEQTDNPSTKFFKVCLAIFLYAISCKMLKYVFQMLEKSSLRNFLLRILHSFNFAPHVEDIVPDRVFVQISQYFFFHNPFFMTRICNRWEKASFLASKILAVKRCELARGRHIPGNYQIQLSTSMFNCRDPIKLLTKFNDYLEEAGHHLLQIGLDYFESEDPAENQELCDIYMKRTIPLLTTRCLNVEFFIVYNGDRFPPKVLQTILNHFTPKLMELRFEPKIGFQFSSTSKTMKSLAIKVHAYNELEDLVKKFPALHALNVEITKQMDLKCLRKLQIVFLSIKKVLDENDFVSLTGERLSKTMLAMSLLETLYPTNSLNKLRNLICITNFGFVPACEQVVELVITKLLYVRSLTIDSKVMRNFGKSLAKLTELAELKVLAIKYYLTNWEGLEMHRMNPLPEVSEFKLKIKLSELSLADRKFDNLSSLFECLPKIFPNLEKMCLSCDATNDFDEELHHCAKNLLEMPSFKRLVIHFPERKNFYKLQKVFNEMGIELKVTYRHKDKYFSHYFYEHFHQF